MANIFQPTLNPINASPNVIQDQSSTTLLKGLATAGMEAYTGYQEAGLEKSLEEDAAAFFKQNQQYEEGKVAGIEGEGLRIGIDKYWGNVSAEQGDWEQLDFLEKKFKDKMDTYKAAMDQGKMSVDQLYARIISTTREHVSRNPWLQKQLLKTADDYLELTGLGGYIKQAQKSAKEEADMRGDLIKARMLDASKTYGIDPLTDQAWEQKYLQKQQQAAFMKQTQEYLATRKDIRTVEAAEYLKQAADFYPAAMYSGLQNTLIKYMNEVDQNGKKLPWDVQKVKILNEANMFKQEIVSNAAKNGLLVDPTVKDFIGYLQKSTDDLTKALSEKASGESALEYMKISSDMAYYQQKLAVMEVANPQMWAMMKDISTTLGQNAINRYFSDNPTEVQKALSLMSRAFQGSIDPRISDPKVFGGVLDATLEAGKAGVKDIPLGQMFKSVEKTVADPQATPDRTKKIEAYMTLGERLANPNYMDQFKALSDDERRTGTKILMDYIQTTQEHSADKMAGFAEEGYKFGWDQLPNGSFQIVYMKDSKKDSKGEAHLKYLQKHYANHLTNAIKGFSHLMGNTQYKENFDKYFLGKQEQVTSPADADKGFTITSPITKEKLLDAVDKDKIDMVTAEAIAKAEGISLSSNLPEDFNKPEEVKVTNEQEKEVKQQVSKSSPARTGVNPGKESEKKTTINITGAKDLYKPEPKLSKEALERNKRILKENDVTRDHIKQAEREIAGGSWTGNPQLHLTHQEEIMKRAAALAKGEQNLYVSTDIERLRASPKGKWVVYSEGNDRIRFYSPEEKVYVDLPYKDIPQLEKWFKLPKEQWKKWSK